MFLKFCVKHFPNYLGLNFETRFLVDNFLKSHILKERICMVIRFWKLKSNLNWKDVASSPETIIRNSVNYLRRHKSKHSRDLLHIYMNENVFVDSFFFRFEVFCIIVFLSCLHFCLLSLFKWLDVLRNHYHYFNILLLKCNWKMKIWEMFFWHQNRCTGLSKGLNTSLNILPFLLMNNIWQVFSLEPV